MAGTSWLVDKSRIATKIKSASGACDPEKVTWKSNPTRACPSCQYVIDNSDVAQEWPGLPKGVKFDPSDQDIMCHLLAKVGAGKSKPHPFIDEFITTLEVDDGICYTHPKHLPGVNQDGSACHFFHRAVKAYNTGTRKRRKIHGQDFGDVRWHKTGRTKPVVVDGVQIGCKKIMVLYMSMVRGGKAEKTNWVMHQYHLGTQEDENHGEYVVSKVFYQQPQVKLGDKDDIDIPEVAETVEETNVQVDPVAPKSATPDPPFNERRHPNVDLGQESYLVPQPPAMECVEEAIQADCEEPKADLPEEETQNNNEGMDDNENCDDEEPKWWDSESQNLLNSQQLVEALSLCDDLLRSQSPNRDEENGEKKDQPAVSTPVHVRTNPFISSAFPPSLSQNFASKTNQPLRVRCALSPLKWREGRRFVSISIALWHLLFTPNRAAAGGMLDKYVKKKKLDPLEVYVPPIILTQFQIEDLEKTLEGDEPQFSACRSLLRAGPAASLRVNIRAVAQYASDNGNGKTAFNDVDHCLSALEELDSLLLRASRNEAEASVKSMKAKINAALNALDSLLQTVPSDVLSKGKVIADSYRNMEDEEDTGSLDPELKQLQSIL